MCAGTMTFVDGKVRLALIATVIVHTLLSARNMFVSNVIACGRQATGSLPGGLVRNPRSQAAQELWLKEGKPVPLRAYEELLSSNWAVRRGRDINLF